MAFTLSSPAFANGGPIPERHARRADNLLSPFLQWRDPPPGTRSYVLVLEDVDAPAGLARHWAVFDIPADRRQLAEGRSSGARAEGLPHGYNDFGNLGYDGLDPPAGEPAHTYRFRLAALAIAELGLGRRPYAGDLWEVARRNMLAEAELTGSYGRAEGGRRVAGA